MVSFALTVVVVVVVQGSHILAQLPPDRFQVTVDGSTTTQFLTHFWRSTGLW